MKRLILPLLLLLAISMLVAAESPASDVVGYFKITAPLETWTPVSYPFEITDGTPSSVFGENWASSEDLEVTDYIINASQSTIANYYTSPDFTGWYTEADPFVNPGDLFWVYRTQETAFEDFFMLGKVLPSEYSIAMAGQNTGGWTAFSLNDVKSIDPNDLDFATTEPDWDNYFVDMIICSNDQRVAEFWGEELGWNALDEQPFYIEPSNSYYYYSYSPSGWNWTYTPSEASPSRFESNKSIQRRNK